MFVLQGWDRTPQGLEIDRKTSPPPSFYFERKKNRGKGVSAQQAKDEIIP